MNTNKTPPTMKKYIKRIKNCQECPACYQATGMAAYDCEKTGKFLGHDDDFIAIPKHCPLEDIGGPVPAPGTTWTVEQIIKYFTNFMKDGFDIEVALEDIKKERNGIAATTERHRKEQG